MRSRPFAILVLVVLPTACGHDSFAPESCQEIEDISTNIGDQQLVPFCFEDADGDELTIDAESSDDEVVEVNVIRGGLNIEGVRSGTAIVTVTATDPSGQMASQGFSVTVINRQPESASLPRLTLTDDALSAELLLTDYFADPDGHSLTFTADVNDPTVVMATVEDSLLTVNGRKAGTAIVRVIATDPEGLTATERTEVVIRVREQLMHEDFNSELSSNWRSTEEAILEFADGRLGIGTTDPNRAGLILQDLLPSENWLVSANVENATDDLWSALWIETGNTEVTALLFIFGGDLSRLVSNEQTVPKTNFAMAAYYSSDRSWGTALSWNGTFDEIRGPGESMNVSVSMEATSLKISIDGVEIHEVPAIDRDGNRLPATISQIRILGYPPLDLSESGHLRVYFDWVVVNGIRQEAGSVVADHLATPITSAIWIAK